MALDLHSKVTIKSIERLELAHGDTVLLRVIYRVKRGRKDYKLWALPSDFRGTGIFPICYRRMNSGRYGDVLDMNNNVLWTGDLSTCRTIVKIANKHYMEGA
jgi:hypothetical protein